MNDWNQGNSTKKLDRNSQVFVPGGNGGGNGPNPANNGGGQQMGSGFMPGNGTGNLVMNSSGNMMPMAGHSGMQPGYPGGLHSANVFQNRGMNQKLGAKSGLMDMKFAGG